MDQETAVRKIARGVKRSPRYSRVLSIFAGLARFLSFSATRAIDGE
jgi:hypothetical protein